MKKHIFIPILVIVFFFIAVFVFFLNDNNTSTKINVGKSFCDTVISDMSNGVVTMEEDIVNKPLIDEYVEYLVNSDNNIINLSSYFSFLVEENEDTGVENPEDSGLTEEELEDLRNRLEESSENFSEETTIFLNNNGNKCIKVNDLRRLSNLDAVVNYIDGEYIIVNEDIPITLSFLKENAFFDFNLLEVVEKDKNILSFKYENTSNNYPSIFIFDIYFKGNSVENFVLTINGYNPFNY